MGLLANVNNIFKKQFFFFFFTLSDINGSISE